MEVKEYIIIILTGILSVLICLIIGADIKKYRHKQMCESNNIECCVDE